MPARVLFVSGEPPEPADDEAWETAVAVDADQALEVLANQPVDVVVADLDLPGMDGAELLARLRERHPGAVRILRVPRALLPASRDDAMRAVPVAHQVIAKPTEVTALADAVRRAAALRELLGRDALLDAVGRVDTLPSPPGTWLALAKVLDDPRSGPLDVARIVRQDPGMSAKLLQLVNSSFASLRRRVRGVDEAVTYLGLATLRSLALSVGAFRAFRPEGRVDPDLFDRLAANGVLCAELARDLVHDRADADDAFAAGLLHDVGQLVLAANLADTFVANLDAASERGEPLHQVEWEQGFTHADVGAYLLALWGLPAAVVDAVAHHHDPPPDPTRPGVRVGVTEAVQLAVAMVAADA